MMQGRPGRTSQPPPPSGGSGSSRNNEYFVPRDGIDREVITADICRYLGPDALVRPGTYEDQNGQPIQGYYVTAYRNLTSAMIQDLKADSARWESERRAAARNTAGGTPTSGFSNGVYVRNSNSPVAPSRSMPGSEYKDSTTHYNRQTNGPSSASATGGYSSVRSDPDAMMVDAPPSQGYRYPGTGTQGYNGVNSYSQGQGYGQNSYANAPSYAPPQATYVQPSATDRYGGTGFSSAPSASTGMGAPQQDYIQGAAFSTYSNPPPIVSTGNRNTYSAGGQSVYSQEQYYPQSGSHTNYAQHPQLTQPTDAFYGRGNQTTSAQGYGSIPAEASVSNSSPANPALQQRIPSPTSGSQAQMMNSGAAAALRDSRDFDRDRQPPRDVRERERGDRDRDRERRNRDERDRDQDRDEPMESRHSSHRVHRTRP